MMPTRPQSVCVCVFVSVYVRDREREREYLFLSLRVCVCVRVLPFICSLPSIPGCPRGRIVMTPCQRHKGTDLIALI